MDACAVTMRTKNHPSYLLKTSNCTNRSFPTLQVFYS